MKRILPLLLFLPAIVWAQALEIIPLQYRMADQLLPSLLPFVERGGALSGANDKLFLRASSRNQAEIRRLVAELDVPLRRLMISVRQEGEDENSARGGRVNGSVTFRDGKVGAGGTAHLYSSTRAGNDRVSQQVQTIDGGRAAIVVGQSLWLPLRQMVIGPGGAVVSETIVQRDLGTGFVAVPRLSGNRVSIEVSPRHDTPGVTPFDTRVERLVTTVSGPLGEWIALGGSSQDEAEQGAGNSWGVRSVGRQRRLLLKVDELP
jgi:hypothetical protein